MSRSTIKLSRRYEAHGKSFDEIVFREPTYAEIFIEGLGRPQEWQSDGNGKFLLLTFPDVIDRYVQRLAVEPSSDCLSELSAHDCMRIEKAICGFFLEPAKQPTSPPVSCSGSDGTPAVSGE